MHKIRAMGAATWAYRGIWFTSDHGLPDVEYYIMTPDIECYAETKEDVKSIVDKWIELNGSPKWYSEFMDSKIGLYTVSIPEADVEKIIWAKKHNAVFEVVQDSLVTDVLI